MKNRKGLDWLQKGCLIALGLIFLLFTVLYLTVGAQKGYVYRNSLLLESRENGNTVYSGKLDGERARFSVSDDHQVTLTIRDKSYGPITAREEPSAVPEAFQGKQQYTGVEVLRDDQILFRGAAEQHGEQILLYDEKGEFVPQTILMTAGDGTLVDMNGKPAEMPDAHTVLELLAGPPLSPRADWSFWLYGLLMGVLTALVVLFARKLFDLHMSWYVREPEKAEPSGWVVNIWRGSWVVLTVLTGLMFLLGFFYLI